MKVICVNLVRNLDILIDVITKTEVDIILISEGQSFKYTKSFGRYDQFWTNNNDVGILINKKYQLKLCQVLMNEWFVSITSEEIKILACHLPRHPDCSFLKCIETHLKMGYIVGGDFNTQVSGRYKDYKCALTSETTTMNNSCIDNLIFSKVMFAKTIIIKGRDHYILLIELTIGSQSNIVENRDLVF